MSERAPWTPLHFAAQEGSEAAARVLIDRQNHHEVSPRSLAETIGNYDVARYFD